MYKAEIFNLYICYLLFFSLIKVNQVYTALKIQNIYSQELHFFIILAILKMTKSVYGRIPNYLCYVLNFILIVTNYILYSIYSFAIQTIPCIKFSCICFLCFTHDMVILFTNSKCPSANQIFLPLNFHARVIFVQQRI